MAQFFIDRPVFAWVIALVIMLAGLLSLQNLPVAAYPDIAPPALSIRATYPGASPETLQESIAAPIEQEMNGIEGLLYLDSSSESSGTVSINLTFRTGTNLDIASVEAQNRIARVEPRLPEEVRRQGIQVNKSRRNYLMFVSLTSPDDSFSAVGLGNYASVNLLDNIRRVPGVGEANLFGSEYAMRIWLDPARLTSFNLAVSDVLAAVRAQNTQVASGDIGAAPSVPGQQLTAKVVTQGQLVTPEEFGAIIVRANPDGSTVRLADVARVELDAGDYSVKARLNGRPAATMAIKLLPGGNALETAEAVKARMTELARNFPPGIAWDVPYDTSLFVDVSLDEVLKTLLEAAALVVLVMYVFLQSVRATFIPAIVVPVALAGALTGLLALGFSINVLTLFGMVLAIGLVVDDAIVVIENVERIMREEGLNPREATKKAMQQITGAIIGITLVLIAVFVPMAFFSGSVGAIYRQFAVTLVMAMGFSALLALSLTPALCASLLKPVRQGEEHRGLFRYFNRGFARTTTGYRNVVARALATRGRYLLLYLGLVGIAAFLLFRLPTGFLPDEDQGYFITIVQLPAGATQERTLKVMSKVEQYYLSQPAISKVISVAGFSFFGRGPNAGIHFVRLKDWEDRSDAALQIDAVVEHARRELGSIKEAIVLPINVPPIPELGAVGGFDFRLQDRSGKGGEALKAAQGQALGLAGQQPELAGVRPESLEDAPQLRLDVDRAKAQALGVAVADINQTLQTALGSSYVNDFVRQGRVLRVQMQAEASARMRPEDILALHVRNAEGDMVPLSAVATPRWEIGAAKLDRYNGYPSVKLSGNAAPGYSTGDAMMAMEEVARQLPPGFGFDWSGQSYEQRLSGAQAPLLFGLSIMVVFLVLAALYESWSIPLAVLLAVPLGVLGAVIAVTLTCMPNDVYFKVGLIAIIGLAAKNAILIVEFAKDLRKEGTPLVEATIEAARLRFRPILMTSIAFTLGVLPLALSSGAGAAARQAIGTGVMGGMIAATVFAVFLVPVFFVSIRGQVEKWQARRHADYVAPVEKPAHG